MRQICTKYIDFTIDLHINVIMIHLLHSSTLDSVGENDDIEDEDGAMPISDV